MSSHYKAQHNKIVLNFLLSMHFSHAKKHRNNDEKQWLKAYKRRGK